MCVFSSLKSKRATSADKQKFGAKTVFPVNDAGVSVPIVRLVMACNFCPEAEVSVHF